MQWSGATDSSPGFRTTLLGGLWGCGDVEVDEEQSSDGIATLRCRRGVSVSASACRLRLL
jgi:hypothetical protein